MEIEVFIPTTLSPPPPSSSPSSTPSSSSTQTSTTAITTTTTIVESKNRKAYGKKDGAPAASTSTSKATKSGSKGERMTFELDDVLRKYSPEQFKTCKAYDVGGVNILNKKPIDSKTALDKIKRRRETHNRVERRRRDCINQII
ncbi:hypothetical protein BGZ65_012970 [Modicella reniformis]|uniref:BHLH domain-containing protein n=1 Tax=Modicella reniformis TaxID=1440133 RepID=A0A9P6MK53_9FUNG|nr:hypothetical protein BGZ65_012970 [Modicella reniformis]